MDCERVGFMKRLGLVSIGAILLSAGSAGAGYGYAQGSFSGYGQLDWRSNCSKPLFPQARNAESWQTSSVTSDYQRYSRCVTDRARNDIEYASDRVIEEARDEIDKVKDDAELAGWTFR